MVAVYYVLIRKWSEVLRQWMMWLSCSDKSSARAVYDHGWII